MMGLDESSSQPKGDNIRNIQHKRKNMMGVLTDSKERSDDEY